MTWQWRVSSALPQWLRKDKYTCTVTWMVYTGATEASGGQAGKNRPSLFFQEGRPTAPPAIPGPGELRGGATKTGTVPQPQG